MIKIKHLLYIITLNILVSCGLLGTYDNVELMAGIQIPLYDTNINCGLHLILKDQAINKLKENQNSKLIESKIEILRYKFLKGAKND